MFFEINDSLRVKNHEPLETTEDPTTFGLALWVSDVTPCCLLQVTIGDNWWMAAEEIIANIDGFYIGNAYKTIAGVNLANKHYN